MSTLKSEKQKLMETLNHLREVYPFLTGNIDDDLLQKERSYKNTKLKKNVEFKGEEVFMTKDSVEEIGKQLKKLHSSIKNLLDIVQYDSDNIRIEDNEDAEELFLRDEYRQVMSQLEDVHSRLEYLSKEVVKQGRLYRNENGRFELSESLELSSGSLIEFSHSDHWSEANKWIATKIEHKNGDYYLYDFKDIELDGLHVRIRQ